MIRPCQRSKTKYFFNSLFTTSYITLIVLFWHHSWCIFFNKLKLLELSSNCSDGQLFILFKQQLQTRLFRIRCIFRISSWSSPSDKVYTVAGLNDMFICKCTNMVINIKIHIQRELVVRKWLFGQCRPCQYIIWFCILFGRKMFS